VILLGMFLRILIARSLIMVAVDGRIAEKGHQTIGNDTTSQMPPLTCQPTHRPTFLNMCMGSVPHLHRIGDTIAVACHSPHRADNPVGCYRPSPLSAPASVR